MLEININDVYSMLETCRAYLIGIGAAVILAVCVILLCSKMERRKRKLIRSQSVIAAILVICVILNMVCVGPVSTLLTLTSEAGTLNDDTTEAAIELGEEIAGEGIVLLKDTDDILPLKTKNLNVFGWASTNPCYGGSGSGALSDAYHIVGILEGLENAGFALNDELTEFYQDYAEERGKLTIFKQDWTLPEPPAENYSDELMENAKEFSDTAVVVISRLGGEGMDLPTDVSQVTYNNNSDKYSDFQAGEHYLQLSQTEKDMLDLVCNSFDDVVVIYNGANAMELNFVNEYEQIKGAIWCPGPGQTGFNSLGKILSGEINPSGKTTDTFVADLTKTPSYNNFGSFFYDNLEEHALQQMTGDETNPAFVNLVEGIYVGYRYYETAAQEGAIDYDSEVVYPFGYGLSYTAFERQIEDFQVKDGTVSIEVKVTNTGDTAGKDVVEVYYDPPYTNGGIEKAAANLIAFEKTGELAPGKSETVKITFKEEDMASYDYLNEGCYVLEKGDYKISIRSDSHNIIEEKTYTVDQDIIYNEQNARSTDKTTAVNQFEDVTSDLEYLSRADGFANYEKVTAAPENFSISEDKKADFISNANYDPKDYDDPEDEMPTTGADNGLTLADFTGKDYDDPQWEELLDQMSLQDMLDLVAIAGYQTGEVASVGKEATVDCDGPASINNTFSQTSSVGFPCAVVLAATWNQELALEFGECMGKMADELGVTGWYAPAMNIHRSAFGGRNFEYYSEDGLLSGKMGARSVAGAWEYGVYGYLKHFALNGQDTNRTSMLCTWASEQAIREIYLKPFELSVKEGNAHAVMTSLNCIGTVPTAASEPLLMNVLRGEWGFEGFVLTDTFSGGGYQNADRYTRAGNDAMLCAFDTDENYVKDVDSATAVLALRRSCKNIMYTVANSRVYQTMNDKALKQWQKILILADGVVFLLLAVLEVITLYKFHQRKKNAIIVDSK